jgi:hypothetical protein
LITLLLLGGCNQKAPSAQKPSSQASEQPVFVSTPDQPVRNPFPTATEVRLFVDNEYKGDKPSFSKPNGLKLTKSQRENLESQLHVFVVDPNEPVIGCFIPHHFFRYYDNGGAQIGELEVCFCCAGVRVSGAHNIAIGPNSDLGANYLGLEKLVASLGERTDIDCVD